MDTITHALVPLAARIGVALGIVGLLAAVICVALRWVRPAASGTQGARKQEALGSRVLLVANVLALVLIVQPEVIPWLSAVPNAWQMPLALAVGIWSFGVACHLSKLIWARREARVVMEQSRDIPVRLQQMLDQARERMGLARAQVRPVLASPLLSDETWIDGQVVLPTKVAEGEAGTDDRLFLLRHLIHSERDDAKRLSIYRWLALPWWWHPGLRHLSRGMIDGIAQIGREGAEAWAEINENPRDLSQVKLGNRGWAPVPHRRFALGLTAAALAGLMVGLLSKPSDSPEVTRLSESDVLDSSAESGDARRRSLSSMRVNSEAPWSAETPKERHVWQRHGRVFTAEYRGHIEPTFDRLGFSSMPTDGFVELTMKSGKESWKLRASRAPDGSISDTLTLNAKAAPNDPDRCHKARLGLLNAAYSQTALATRARVSFAIHRDGFDEALDLVTRCRRGTPRLQWLREMLSHAWLPEEVACVVSKASSLLKGVGLQELVRVAAHRFTDCSDLTLDLVKAASRHDVSPMRGKLITEVIEARPLHYAASIAAVESLRRGCASQSGAFLLARQKNWLTHDQLRPQWFHALRQHTDRSLRVKALKSLIADPDSDAAILALAEPLLTHSGLASLEALVPDLIARSDDPKLIEKMLSRGHSLSHQAARDNMVKAAIKQAERFPTLIAPLLSTLGYASSTTRTQALLDLLPKTKTPAQLSECLEVAEGDCSGRTVYALVAKLSERRLLDSAILARCLECVKHVDSSSKRSRLLASLSKHLKDAQLDTWLKRLWGLRSESDRLAALAALVKGNQLSEQSLSDLRKQAKKRLRGGSESLRILIKQPESASL